MKKSKSEGVIKDEREESIIGGALSLTVAALVVKVLGLIYKLPMSAILGDVGMGYFNSAYTVYAFFYLLCTAGVPKAIMILVSGAKANQDTDMQKQIIKVAMGVFVVLGIILMLLFIIMAAPLASLIGNSKSVYTMIAIAPTILLVAIGGVIRGLLSANMLFSDIAISQVIEGIGKLVFGLSFAILGNHLKLPMQIISALTILGVTLGTLFGVLYLLICSKTKILNEKSRQSAKCDKKRIVRRIFSISVPITLSAAILSITGVIDLGLIMRSLKSIGYTETEASSLYGNYTTLAVPMFNLALSIISPISIAFLPTITSASAKGDASLIKNAENSALDMTCIVSAPITIGLCLFSGEILSILFKNSDINIGAPLLALLTPAILFSSLLMLLNSILESLGYVKAPMISMLFGGIGKLTVSYLLIRNPNFGISGAPIGTVIFYAIALIVSLAIYGKRTGRTINIFRLLLSTYLPSLVIILVAKILYMILFSSIGSIISLIISIVFSGLLYISYLLFSGKANKSELMNLAKYTNFVGKNYLKGRKKF